jgi:hypothetical protein
MLFIFKVMVSPGRLFNTPPGVRMSPGKKRVFQGGRNLISFHAALTRASAALSESRNLHARMMEAGVHKRAARNRARKLDTKLFNLRHSMKWTPSASEAAAFQQRINQAQKELNAILLNVHNKERTSTKLIKQWENSKKRYHQLARRVVNRSGVRTFNNSPLTQRELNAVRVTSRVIKNMSEARRTVRHFPLPQHMGMLIIRSAARR